MTKLGYWNKRYLRIKAQELQNTSNYEQNLKSRLSSLEYELEQEANVWYSRYADNHDIDTAAAKKLLKAVGSTNWNMTLEEFRRKAIKGGYTKELDSEYFKSRIARLQDLEKQLKEISSRFASDETESFSNRLTGQFQETYMTTIFNTQVQQAKLTGNFARYNENQIKYIVNKPWHKEDFSKRVWKNYYEELPNQLIDVMLRGTFMGYSPARITRMFQQRFEDIRRHQIHRLVITEMGHIAEQATFKAYEESGIEEYEYMATLESHTCEACAHLDGEIFKMSEKKEGINYPLIHPHCRCTTVPHMEGLLGVGERWMRDPETGKGNLVNNVTFNEWKDYVNNDYLKSRPYINNVDVRSSIKVPNNIRRRTMQKAEEVIENNKFLKSRFSNEKLNIYFDESLFLQHPDAAGVTPPGINKTIKLNPAIHKSKESISDYVKRNDGQFVSVRSSQLDSYPVVHELGHVLHNELWDEYTTNNPSSNLNKNEFIADQIRSIYNIYEKDYDTKVTPSKLPSKYSIVNNNELFAELFTESQIGYESNRWNQVMKKYLRKVNR